MTKFKFTALCAATLCLVAFSSTSRAEDKMDKSYNNESGFHQNDRNLGHSGRKHKNKRGQMDINLAAMPTSINGTYEIDRFVIKEGDKIILDSDNDFAVADDKGYLTINMTVGKEITLEMIYNMQMVGPAFQNPELAKYNFLYDKQTFKMPYTQGQSISAALSTIGMTVYDHEDVYWEMPFEKGKRLFMKIEKESDNIMQLTNKPYYKTN